jgi:hypothetical protein
VKFPVRVSDVVRSLAGSGLVAAVAFLCSRASHSIYGGCRLRSPRQFTQHNGLNFMGIGVADLGEGTVDGFSHVGVREPDRWFGRRLNGYPTPARVGNKVAVT